jgi:hypothetical protein
MPVDFSTEAQKEQYGKFSAEPNDTQLARYFHLDETDMAVVSSRREDHNKLGFALQLTSVRFLGTFLSDVALAPVNVQAFVAKQLSIQNIDVLSEYANRDTTKREHTALIRKHYGYCEFGDPPWAFRLSRLLYARTWVGNERPSLMFDFTTGWLIQKKVLLPGPTILTRLIAEIRERAAKRLWRQLSLLPTKEQKVELETLLEVADGMRISCFDQYRKGPVTISSPAFNRAIDRYLGLRAFGIHKLNFSNIPLVRLKNLARYAGMISMHKVARMPFDKRIAVLVAFVKAFETIALDDALDIVVLLITDWPEKTFANIEGFR